MIKLWLQIKGGVNGNDYTTNIETHNIYCAKIKQTSTSVAVQSILHPYQVTLHFCLYVDHILYNKKAIL